MTVLAPVALLLALLVTMVFGWAIPSLSMRALMPALESSSHQITNYRGRRIPTGLGLVWVVWAASMAVGMTLLQALPYALLGIESELAGEGISRIPVNALEALPFLPLTLVVGAALFGLVDDLYGDANAKGFRGHLSALAQGRLTTGGLKLLGIGALSLFAAVGLGPVRLPAGWAMWAELPVWLLAGMVIALVANFVNLTDLRPGRALKSYSVLATIGITLMLASAVTDFTTQLEAFSAASPVVGFVETAVMVIFLVFGPVFAVWKLDLGERGMLGDAGANAMGAFAGYLLVAYSPLWLIFVWFVVFLALNLASEKFSFTRVIERVGFLAWFDGLGRLPQEPERGMTDESDEGARAGGPVDPGENA